MITFDLSGIAGLYLKFEGNLLDAAQSIPEDILHPPVKTYIRFTVGTAALIKGVILHGNTSAAILTVDGVVVTSGTLAGGDGAGILFITVASGTIVTGEDLHSPAHVVLAIARTELITIEAVVMDAKTLLVQAETNSLRLLFDGSDPTSSTETGDANYGIILAAMDSIAIKGWKNVANFKVINAVAANNGVCNIQVLYGGVE